jgi:hypothetical protein
MTQFMFFVKFVVIILILLLAFLVEDRVTGPL